MLIAIILLGAFGLVAARLFHSTMLASFRASTAQNEVAAFDRAVAALRADAWAATTLNVADPATVTVTRGDAGGDSASGTRSINWRISGSQIIRGDGRRAWSWPIPPGCSFAAEGAALVLVVPETKTTGAATLRFDREMELLGGITRR
jgi:type II secretory pathway pseudopilin PulG